MDNLTHTLFAATLARTSLGHAGRGTTAVLVLASNAPDLDVVATIGGGLGYLDWHRGPTHGPLGVIVLGLVAAGLVWLAMRGRERASPGVRSGRAASLPMLAALGMLGVALHVTMDLPTSYGTRALSPFSSDWLTTDWMPIVDIYLLTLLGAGLVIGRRTAARRGIAMAVLLLMAVNYGVRAVAHGQAMALAPQAFGPRLPLPCGVPPAPAVLTRWEGRARFPVPPESGGRCLLDVAAIPTFLSPFRWQLIAQTSNAYELQAVDLWRDRGPGAGRPWRLSRRFPDHWTPAVVRAAESDVGRRFLSFSRFPAARSVLEEDGSTTVRWMDMRFAPGPATPRVSPDRRSLFSAMIRVASDGRILDERLGR